MEIEEMVRAENDDITIRSHRVEVRKADCPPDGNPSIWNNFFQKLGGLLENIFRAEETSLRL